MKRILLVDDEHHVVDWLYELMDLEPGLDVELFKAYSACGAMEHLRRTKIDVVVTDIRMPGTSGLELLERIHEGWPHCRVIMLTGHREFEYIYQAEKYPGTIYLMKTEDDDAILQAVRTQLAAVEKALLEKETMEESRLKSRLLAQSLLFGEWARSGVPPTGEELAAHKLETDSGALRLVAFAPAGAGPGFAERLYLLACRYMGHLYHIVQWGRGGGLVLWMLQPVQTGNLQNGEAVARLTQVLDDICTTLLAGEGGSSLAVLVDDGPTPFAGVPARAEELGQLALGLAGAETVITTPDTMPGGREENSAQELVTHIKRYVRQNLSGDLSLTAIAGQVCYNTSYVSRIFRREEGIKLSEYIIEARIEQAKRILAGENHSVNDVARMVGFDTPQYFATVFRRYTGLAPARYRTKMRTGQ